MSGFVEGIDRSQSTFFPAMLDDYVAEDNLVRAVDAFVEGLELGKLGSGRVAPLKKGRSAGREGRPMRRREFISLLGGAAAWVSPARAQEPRRVIGLLSGFRFPSFLSDVAVPAFLQGLKDAGFVEGRNITIEIRHADGDYDRLPSLAAELVRRNVAAIYVTDVPAAFAAKAATETIPIVFVIGAAPSSEVAPHKKSVLP